MAEDIAFNVKIEGANSLGQLKQLFKEQQAELGKAKQGTEEYQKALENLGKVKDEIGDLRATIGALNPEGKVAAFQNVASKLASGFSAATGAAALFGSKSADVEKALLKVQAAMALSEGIKSLTGLSDAFAVLKATLLSFNPILLGFTIAIAAIAAAYKIWSDNMSQAAKNDALLNAELERQAKLQEATNAEIDRELALKKELGLKNSEIAKAELEAESQKYAALRTRQVLLQQIKDKTDEQREEQKKLDKEEADSYNNLLILKLKANHTLRDENLKDALDQKKISQQAYDDAKKASDERIKNIQDLLSFNAKQNEDYDAKILQEKTAAHEAELKEFEATLKSQSDLEAQQRKEEEDASKKMRDADFAEFKDRKSKELELEKQTAEAKKQIIDVSLNAAQSLSDAYFQTQLNSVKGNSAEELKIKKKQFEVNKAFNIAAATMDGIRAVQAALTIPPPFGEILAAVNAGLALANVAKIASTQFDSGTPSISSPSTNTSTPVINNQSNTQGSTRLDSNGKPIDPNAAPITQVVVLENDITRTQRTITRVREQSKIG